MACSYCGNNPAKWADPYGFCKGDSLWSRWERFVQSNSGLRSLGSYAIGLLEGAYEMDVGIYNTVVHPVQTAKALPSAVANIPNAAVQFYGDITSPDPDTFGGALGRFTWTLETTLAASGAAKNLNFTKATSASSSPGKYLFDNWSQGTFPNKMQSVRYHLAKHAEGMSATQYTKDALEFFKNNKSLAQPYILKTGEQGLKISGKTGGILTSEGKVVSFWYGN